MATEKFEVTASSGLIIKVLAALLAAGGVAGGYKSLAQTPEDRPSAVLNRIDGRLDRMTDDVAGLKVDVGLLKAQSLKDQQRNQDEQDRARRAGAQWLGVLQAGIDAAP